MNDDDKNIQPGPPNDYSHYEPEYQKNNDFPREDPAPSASLAPLQRENAKTSGNNKGRIIALALSCTLLGATVGGTVGGIVAYNSAPKAEVSAASSPNNSNISLLPASSPEVGVKDVLADGSQLSIAQVYKNVNSSVVAISTESTRRNVFGQQSQRASAGSGFILSKDGYIVTNNHVIATANKISVSLFNGKTYDAKLIGRDEDSDLAVLKIDEGDLSPVIIGDSDKIQVGDQVIAIGNPLGELANTLTSGYLSSLKREINIDGNPMNMLQTDAAISPGNSGGPLINLKGEVIGINSAKSMASGVEGLGFAIPINDAMKIIDKLIKDGYVSGKAQLGVTCGVFTKEMSEYYKLPEGVYLVTVQPGSCANKAGMVPDDIITKVDDKDIRTVEQLQTYIRSKTAGDEITVHYNRGKESKTTKIKLDEKAPESKFAGDAQRDNSSDFGGNYKGFEDFFNQFN